LAVAFGTQVLAFAATYRTAKATADGIPSPILWGLLSFITNYIPNIGASSSA